MSAVDDDLRYQYPSDEPCAECGMRHPKVFEWRGQWRRWHRNVARENLAKRIQRARQNRAERAGR